MSRFYDVTFTHPKKKPPIIVRAFGNTTSSARLRARMQLRAQVGDDYEWSATSTVFVKRKDRRR